MRKIIKIIKITGILIVCSCIINLFNVIYIKLNNGENPDKIFSFLSFHKDVSLSTYLELDYSQQKDNTCGLAALRYLLYLYGLNYSEKELVNIVELKKDGVSMLELTKALDRLDLQGIGLKTNYEKLEDLKMPVIAFINNDHYIVIENVYSDKVIYFDPAPGMGTNVIEKGWFNDIWDGIILQVKTKPLKLSN